MSEYKVTGGRPYAGHQPGETFSADLSSSEEERAIKRGSIQKVEAKAPAQPPEEEQPSEGGGMFGLRGPTSSKE